MKIFSYPSTSAEERVLDIINRGIDFKDKDYQDVVRIIDEVKKEGDQAVIRYTNRFDSQKVTMDTIKVTKEEMDAASQEVDRVFTKALSRAIKQIESFHRQQVQRSWFTAQRPGVFLGQMVNPVDAAGIYVPGAKGGKTPLVSSVLMGAIPAKIAGVKHVAMATPPTESGKVNPFLLAAAKKVGIDVIYKTGSAWAIAALAYGTESIGKVDVIVGPGNIYVTIAKKIVSGTVGIDMIAGPSEVLIVADNTANCEFIAADLLSQAEHDLLASAILITDDKELARDVAESVAYQLKSLARKDIARASLDKFGAVLIVPNIGTAIELANNIAPEHLELHVKDPFECIAQIRNAGAVFMGEYTPEPVGDYIAGPNHVLPTAGTARFSSALSVDHFIKKTSLLHYSSEAFKKEAKDIIRLADIEGLDAHANSIQIRLKNP